MDDWSPTKVENLVDRDAWVNIDDVLPDVRWFWTALARRCEIACCGLDALDLTEDSVRWACGEDVPQAEDRVRGSDEPGDPRALADRLREAARQTRDLGEPAVTAWPFNKVLTAESYASLFENLAAKVERVGSPRPADSEGEPSPPRPEREFSAARLDRSRLPTTVDECRNVIDSAAATLTEPSIGSPTTVMIMGEGRDLVRHVARSETGRLIVNGLIDAHDFVRSFAGDRSGQIFCVTVAGILEGRVLAAAVSGMPAARDVAFILGRYPAGLDSVVTLARSPMAQACVASFCQSEAALSYASVVAQTEVGELLALYLTDSNRAIPSLASAVTRDDETRATFRQVSETKTCSELAAVLLQTETGRNLVDALTAHDSTHEILSTIQPPNPDSTHGDTATTALTASSLMLHIVMQYAVITAGLVAHVAIDATSRYDPA